MVLRSWKQNIGPPVSQNMQTDLDPFKKFLNDNTCPSLSKLFIHHNGINGLLGFFNGTAQQYPLAQGKAISLNGAFTIKLCGKSLGGRGKIKRSGAGSGNLMAHHKILTKDFRGLKLCCFLIRPPYTESIFLE